MIKHLRGNDLRRRVAIAALLSLSLAACSWHWPWHRRPSPPPTPVHVVSIAPEAGAPAATIEQYWDRNTLLIDLSAVGAEGAAVLTPSKALGWPVRLEFRVRPGSIARLEVLAAQRVLYSVPGQGNLLLLKLAPGAYLPDTPQITLRWNAAADSAP